MDGMRMKAEMGMMVREMEMMEGRGKVQYVVIPVALATGAGSGVRGGASEVGARKGRTAGEHVGKRSRGRGARRRRRERRARGRGMSRQNVELGILMGEGIGCMTDGGEGVVVWEGAWEQERREREGTMGTAGAEGTSI